MSVTTLNEYNIRLKPTLIGPTSPRFTYTSVFVCDEQPPGGNPGVVMCIILFMHSYFQYLNERVHPLIHLLVCVGGWGGGGGTRSKNAFNHYSTIPILVFCDHDMVVAEYLFQL